MKDHCTWFPEYWRKTYIGDCCKKHDRKCSSHEFYTCLKRKIGFFSSIAIAIGGGLGCWAKQTRRMVKKI